MAQNESAAGHTQQVRDGRDNGSSARQKQARREGDRQEGKSDEKKEPLDDKRQDDAQEKPPAYKRPGVIIPIVAVLVVALAAGVLYWLHARHFESTDDAYIDGHVAQISPQIAAQVLALHFDDNQFVHRWDLLVELDSFGIRLALLAWACLLISFDRKAISHNPAILGLALHGRLYK